MGDMITNRDIILKLEEVAEDVAVIKAAAIETNGKVKDHELRLREIERVKGRLLGGLGLCAVALPIVLSALYTFTHL